MLNTNYHYILKNFSLDTFIETGTLSGETVDDVSSFFSGKVITVDCNDAKLKNPKVEYVVSDSAKYLDKTVNSLTENTVFYLDAHSYESTPLRDEIKAIMRKPKSVVIIDDFLVPHKWWHRFDVYQYGVNSWRKVKDLFPAESQVFFPKEANADGRGSVAIFTGYHKLDLPKELFFAPEEKDDLLLETIFIMFYNLKKALCLTPNSA